MHLKMTGIAKQTFPMAVRNFTKKKNYHWQKGQLQTVGGNTHQAGGFVRHRKPTLTEGVEHGSVNSVTRVREGRKGLPKAEHVSERGPKWVTKGWGFFKFPRPLLVTGSGRPHKGGIGPISCENQAGLKK